MTTTGGTTFGFLTRADLRGFDSAAQEIILAACAAGATARVSNRGHAIIRAPKGGTMSVARELKSMNRGLQNSVADFKRLFGMNPSDAFQKDRAMNSNGKQDDSAGLAYPSDKELDAGVKEKFPCPAKNCTQVFDTEGARYSHVEKNHERCKHPGCGFASDSKQATSAHFRIVHEGWAPRRGVSKTGVAKPEKKPAAKKPRAKKAVAKPAKKEAVKAVEVTAESLPATPPIKVEDPLAVLTTIHDLLGRDPRLAEMEKAMDDLRGELEASQKRVHELEAKLHLMKEALDL